MAKYKDQTLFTHDNDTEFTKVYNPGMQPKYSGIYRCTGCGHEVVAEKERKLPPENHHQHPSSQDIAWKLVVRPD